MDELGQHYLETVVATFASQKRLAEGALAQLEPADFQRQLDPESNAVAVIVKHLSGNMQSRWRDFLTSDGEKPERDRDAEFVSDAATPAEVMAVWEAGWAELLATLDMLTPQDLLRTVTIRGEKHSVLEAVERQMAHYAQHVGQMVLLAKHFRGADWQTLSIARGASQAFDPSQRAPNAES